MDGAGERGNPDVVHAQGGTGMKAYMFNKKGSMMTGVSTFRLYLLRAGGPATDVLDVGGHGFAQRASVP